MEILPGEGVALARVGESRDVVESRVGPPVHPGRQDRAVYATSPMLVISYFEDEVELVEMGYSGDGGEEVFFDGVQLTYRIMSDVVADLEARGHRAVPSDIGFSFRPGFSIFSMGSQSARDLDPQAADDASVVEGVSVAPAEYFLELLDDDDDDDGKPGE
ncbi:hypothetical protein QLQ12_28820 [Actinoplanes sp. NEAU-A12]|uniref:Uncharacterized protein n=1 Tax=Actinoplanes sandaracinus TaxID=3045177 RepID=A0ABT6WSB0_9ACTN|nr:hypothetical protein [Actinoplanes sandaracinus]MDI6102632.1 hypothetical protein [Actinoplanes sandaracinus]